MAEIVDLTADSPPDAPADDSAVVARLELFTGASADAARAALRAHGNDADAAAAARHGRRRLANLDELVDACRRWRGARACSARSSRAAPSAVAASQTRSSSAGARPSLAATCSAGDMVITLGAGDVDRVADGLLDLLCRSGEE